MLANINPERSHQSMYSPKISEDLIPIIYIKAKQSKIPMTRYVNQLLRKSLTEKVSDKPAATTKTTDSEIKTIAV
jgi:hypothetical protein